MVGVTVPSSSFEYPPAYKYVYALLRSIAWIVVNPPGYLPLTTFGNEANGH